MLRTGRDTTFGLKNTVFTLKIEIRKKCISWSIKCANKNIIVNNEEIWLNMFPVTDLGGGDKVYVSPPHFRLGTGTGNSLL